MSEVTAVVLTPQEKKEQYLQSLQKRIEGDFIDGSLTTSFTTSSCAPAYGWSVEEHLYMPVVASRLREKGYTVSSSVNWGVTDWLIAL
jgi:hypothetical protein